MLFMNRHLKYLDPDALPGSGSTTADAAGAEAETPTAETAGSDGTQHPTFTQADLDRVLADRLARQEKKLRRELEEQADKAKEEELANAAEWQTLAEKRQKQIAKLEEEKAALQQTADLSDKYAKALAAYVKQLSDGLPEAIVGLLAGKDEAEKLEWLTANRAQFVKAEGQETAVPPTQDGKAPPPTPPASTDSNMSVEQRRKLAYTARI